MSQNERSGPPAKKGRPDENSTESVTRLTREELLMAEAVDLLKRELNAVVVEEWVQTEAEQIQAARLLKRAQAEALGLGKRRSA